MVIISARHLSYLCRCVTRRLVMQLYRRFTRQRGVFSTFFPMSLPFRVTRHQFSALKTCFPIRAHTAGSQTLPSPPSSHPHPSPSSDHFPPILLAVKLYPLCPVVILHFGWWPTSPLTTQQSSSYHPSSGQTVPSPPSGHPPPSTSSGGQPHPSPPSGHLPPILAGNLTPLPRDDRRETRDERR